MSKTSQPWVATLVRTIFDQPDPAEVAAQFDRVVTALQAKLPAAAVLMEQNDEWTEARRYMGLDVLAKMTAPGKPGRGGGERDRGDQRAISPVDHHDVVSYTMITDATRRARMLTRSQIARPLVDARPLSVTVASWDAPSRPRTEDHSWGGSPHEQQSYRASRRREGR